MFVPSTGQGMASPGSAEEKFSLFVGGIAGINEGWLDRILSVRSLVTLSAARGRNDLKLTLCTLGDFD